MNKKETLEGQWPIIRKCLLKVRIIKEPKLYVKVFKSTAFHIISYLILIGFSILLFAMANFFVLYRDYPPKTGMHSILQLQPGLAVLPRPDSLTSIIRYKIGRRYQNGIFIHDLFSFLQSYERFKQGSRLLDCTKHVAYVTHPKYSCKFPIDHGTVGCNPGNSFGYDEEEPCVILKLNRIFGWMPSFKNTETNKTNIHGFPGIIIKCDGVSDSDRARMGTICYFDEESASRKSEALMPFSDGGCSKDYGVIRNYYFPYKKQLSYQNPFIWVKFYQIHRHVVIMIRCWATADNIEVNFEEGKGSVQFEIFVD